eukprot:scaffold32709_cov36-Tisochrysis_lutea.AAC.1
MEWAKGKISELLWRQKHVESFLLRSKCSPGLCGRSTITKGGSAPVLPAIASRNRRDCHDADVPTNAWAPASRSMSARAEPSVAVVFTRPRLRRISMKLFSADGASTLRLASSEAPPQAWPRFVLTKYIRP